MITKLADLSLTKTSLTDPIVAGGPVEYSITVANAGPSTAIGAVVTDTPPASISTITWSCVATSPSACAAASGTGALNTTATVAPGANVVYTVRGTVASTATGSISNTASVTPPADVTDPDLTNNGATTPAQPVTRVADLAITKTLSTTPVVAGAPVDYTIQVTNLGPSAEFGATVTDTPPATLTNVTWTCTATPPSACSTPSGTDAISTTVNLTVGGSITFTLSATLDPTATGELSNTATITPATGTTDPTPANNTATDTDTITQIADLAITKTDGLTDAIAGNTTTYTIVVSNAGPSSVAGATVADSLPPGFTNAAWTCVADPTSSCSAPSGSGNPNTTVNVAAGGSVTIAVTGRSTRSSAAR